MIICSLFLQIVASIFVIAANTVVLTKNFFKHKGKANEAALDENQDDG